MVKLSQQAIHVIVLGFSSAVIIEEDVPKEFRYKIVSYLTACDLQTCVYLMYLIEDLKNPCLQLNMFCCRKVGKDIMGTDCRSNTRSKLEQFYASLSRGDI